MLTGAAPRFASLRQTTFALKRLPTAAVFARRYASDAHKMTVREALNTALAEE